MKRTYQITGTLLFLFSAFIAQQSLELKYYTSLGPGPGFFPFWLAIIFGALSAGMVYHATFTRSDPMPADFFPSRIGGLRGLAVLAALVFVVLFMEPLGFRPTMLLFYLFLLFALGRVNIFVTIAVALVGSFGAFQLFNDVLDVPLPVGFLGF